MANHAPTPSSAIGASGPLDRGGRRCWDDVLGREERLVMQGYAGSRRFRAARALLLVDVYNRAFGSRPQELATAMAENPASCGLSAWRALPSLEALLFAARDRRVPIVYTVDGSEPTGNATLRTRHTETGSPAGPWWNQVPDRLAPSGSDLVLAKARASAFFGTPLDSYLRRAGVEALIIAGQTTSGCVRASVVDAFSLGFDVAVVEEATFDRSPLSHKVNMFDMHCKYATAVTPAQATELLAEPGRAELPF